MLVSGKRPVRGVISLRNEPADLAAEGAGIFPGRHLEHFPISVKRLSDRKRLKTSDLEPFSSDPDEAIRSERALVFQRFEPPRLRHVQAAVLGLPLLEGRRAEPAIPA